LSLSKGLKSRGQARRSSDQKASFLLPFTVTRTQSTRLLFLTIRHSFWLPLRKKRPSISTRWRT